MNPGFLSYPRLSLLLSASCQACGEHPPLLSIPAAILFPFTTGLASMDHGGLKLWNHATNWAFPTLCIYVEPLLTITRKGNTGVGVRTWRAEREKKAL